MLLAQLAPEVLEHRALGAVTVSNDQLGNLVRSLADEEATGIHTLAEEDELAEDRRLPLQITRGLLEQLARCGVREAEHPRRHLQVLDRLDAERQVVAANALINWVNIWLVYRPGPSCGWERGQEMCVRAKGCKTSENCACDPHLLAVFFNRGGHLALVAHVEDHRGGKLVEHRALSALEHALALPRHRRRARKVTR